MSGRLVSEVRGSMSSDETPTQHNSTLAISPFVTGRSSTRTNASQSQRQRQNGSHDVGERRASQEWNGEGMARSPIFQSIANSPLVQKTNASITAQSLATPHHHGSSGGNGVGLLASISKSGLFGSTMPSTLRKVSLQREYRDSDKQLNGENEPLTTTTLTTTTSAADELNQLDISDLSSIERLRLWRHDALMQHLYGTAEFVANKIFTLTGDPNDAFWLAQVYYSSGSYVRAVDLLTKDMLESVSIMCRYLLALCLVTLQKYDEALDVVGESNPFSETADQDAKKQNDGGVKLESSLCFLRGKIYAAQNSVSKAKESFKEALLVDVKNFEAFSELTARNLLTPREEWDLLEAMELDFSVLDDNQDMIKNLYMLRLSKYINSEKSAAARKELIRDNNLEANVDIMKYQVETYHTQCKFLKCLDLCEVILERDDYNPDVLPIYISCLYELGSKNKLFLLSHRLAENIPKSPITWFSVATYYMVVEKVGEARKYFSKSSILDPNFAPAWLGFAHTYAIEGEQEQAISAYSTAARFFPGIHLPNLFLGMQYMALNTISLAEEYFTLSYDVCPQDPLLLNEMGVMYFKRNDLHKAKKFLKRALEAVEELDPTSKTSISIQMNLAHAYRRLGENERAIKCFKAVLEVSNKSSDTYCSLGFLYLKTKQLQKAIDHFHVSLSLRPTNSAAQELLLHALELNVSMTLDTDHPLMVNAQIHQSSYNLFQTSKKRAPLTMDVVGLKKMKIPSQVTESSNEDDAMEVECD